MYKDDPTESALPFHRGGDLRLQQGYVARAVMGDSSKKPLYTEVFRVDEPPMVYRNNRTKPVDVVEYHDIWLSGHVAGYHRGRLDLRRKFAELLGLKMEEE